MVVCIRREKFESLQRRPATVRRRARQRFLCYYNVSISYLLYFSVSITGTVNCYIIFQLLCHFNYSYSYVNWRNTDACDGVSSPCMLRLTNTLYQTSLHVHSICSAAILLLILLGFCTVSAYNRLCNAFCD